MHMSDFHMYMLKIPTKVIIYEYLNEKNGYEARDPPQNPDFLWIISGSSWYSSAETHI